MLILITNKEIAPRGWRLIIPTMSSLWYHEKNYKTLKSRNRITVYDTLITNYFWTTFLHYDKEAVGLPYDDRVGRVSRIVAGVRSDTDCRLCPQHTSDTTVIRCGFGTETCIPAITHPKKLQFYVVYEYLSRVLLYSCVEYFSFQIQILITYLRSDFNGI